MNVKEKCEMCGVDDAAIWCERTNLSGKEEVTMNNLICESCARVMERWKNEGRIITLQLRKL